MTIKQEVAYGIIEAITDLRKGDDLEDFTVIVDGISVRCHRFILGACSLFFRALFRSGMKEDEENCAALETVSHSTFTLILSALYTGCDIITEENVIDIWCAAHLLEIGFLVRECEAFVERNISIDNFAKIFETAKLLDSRTVLRAEHKFMTENFDLVRTSQSQTLLKLSYCEISALIDKDELVTSSEDKVVETILQWVSYVSPEATKKKTDSDDIQVLALQNESLNITQKNEDSATDMLDKENEESHTAIEKGRSGNEKLSQDNENQNIMQDKMTSTNEVAIQTSAPIHKETQTAVLAGAEERHKHLFSLISKSRSCLLSPEYLETLLSNPIIVDNPAIRSIMLRAMHYQLQTGHRHGQWPSAAIHRSNSQFKHVLVWTACGNYYRGVRYRVEIINAYNSFSDDEEHVLIAKASSGKITAFDNELYELNDDGLYIFRESSWKKIVSCQLSDKTFMIPLKNLMYFLDGSNKELKSVNPKANTPVLRNHSNFPGEFTVAGAAKYQGKIIVFSSKDNEKFETVVHTFDPSNETWTMLENLEGSAENIIAFNNDEDTFFLQTNGNLLKVTNDTNGCVKIVLCKKAWDFHWNLYGAAIFRRKLIIFGGEMPADKRISFSLPGSNERSKAWTAEYKICTTPITLPSKYLKRKE